MQCVREIKKDIFWVGSNDFSTERFENLFPLPQGVCYNSYLIRDEKTALLDAVDDAIRRQFLENVETVLQGRLLDYLIINHMEPDHCGTLIDIVERYPQVKIVGTKKAFELFEQFYKKPLPDQYIIVKDGDVLDLGQHQLRTFTMPMVHWPEVTATFEETEKILFSADAFGTFGTLNGNLFADETDYENRFLDEARRYYANIVGKYGGQVQNAFKKLLPLGIKMLAPLHGPLFRTATDIAFIVEKYQKWSSYEPEKKGLVIPFGSIYGNSTAIAEIMANQLAQLGVKDIRMYDVSKTHPSFIISEIWKYSHVLFISPTYNLNLFLNMENLLHELGALNFQNRKVSLIANHSWASAAKKVMTEYMTKYKNIEIIGEISDIKSALSDADGGLIQQLASQLAASILGEGEDLK